MDIAVKQAEIEQANLQFAVTQSMNLRQVALQATQAWAGNLLQINGHPLSQQDVAEFLEDWPGAWEASTTAKP